MGFDREGIVRGVVLGGPFGPPFRVVPSSRVEFRVEFRVNSLWFPCGFPLQQKIIKMALWRSACGVLCGSGVQWATVLSD